ncbi:MAG TPA: Fe-S protein assembly co-chaperone HscB [Polyangia bacterium]|nr:Fe-S protein assembly co-chaperone HscB [Polyangia bacterium]
MRTFFDVLGVPRAYHQPAGELERRFHALSRELHPDRFAKAAPRARVEALQKTTELNDAYRVLKDDVKRAEYLIKLEGFDVADEKSASVKPDPALLAEMMELNEQLSDGNQQALARLTDDRRALALRSVDDAFYAFEKGDRSVLPKIAQSLVAIRYYTRFGERAAGTPEEL